MVNFNTLKNSKFLTQQDVTPPKTATVESCTERNVAMESQPQEMKYTLTFKELDKPLVLNFTNASMMAHITGQEDTDDWIGARVELYNDPTVGFGGKITGGIRIRPPQPQTQGGMTAEQKGSYDGASGQRPLSLEEEAESAKRFAEQHDLPDDLGEGQQH